ncbi:DUF4251 domain-containing protein [Parabacteroides acidifaciens]|uniref:DUF4251 domain-containing protein n=1 Tax=Parabacteroides acidifaciens TaxID=2290935 RepID=A0A3D8H9S0_9BACT|nr:DUF4251 domain-containing protein [Parabacteroides acidifaciens]MBC8603675.1 DUF4251 domain-containing protein [Parabacteroides acidifaciens]RDU47591.1 DUF4251 domain-containing protein [Parabacteroides acidifaciens]
MKNIRLLFFMGIVLFLGGQSLYSQTKKERKEQKAKEIKEMIDEQRFTIDVDRALPMGGRTVNLTTPYYFEMRGDSAISYLPYFGRAYSLPYGGGDGLRFEESITDYQSTFEKKGTARIKFVTRTKEDTFRFDVQVFSNGSAIISVTPTNRQSITYQGEVAPKKKE